MPRYRPSALALLALLALLGFTPWPQGTAATQVAAVAAPALMWERGGCFASWCQTGWYSSPAVADLDGDGQQEVIWGSYDVVALNGEDGTLQWRAENDSRVWPGVAVADLTGDGSLEVIAGRGGDQVTVYSAAGGVVWARSPFGGGEVRTLAVTDLESDGVKEVIVGRASGGSHMQINVYEAGGSVRSGFPAPANGAPGYGWGMYNNNIAVADLDGDGDKELIGPTDTHYITAVDHTGAQLPASPIYGAGKVWRQVGVHVSQEIDLQGYAECGENPPAPLARRIRPNFANTAPVIADVNGDGTLEIVVVGDVYDCDAGDPDGDLYHLPWIFTLDRTRWSGSGYDWTAIPAAEPGSGPLSQDYGVIQNSVTSAVVADLDGDGMKEILYPSYDGRLHAYWLDKTQHGSWPFDVPGSGMRFASEPAVVDLDGDGAAEVIVASWPENGGGRVGQLHILDHLGNQLHAVNLPAPVGGATWNGGLGAPTVANIDADPDMEVVVGTVSSGVVAYNLPGSAAARCLWCTGRGSNLRTGVAAAADGFTLRIDGGVATVAPGAAATFSVSVVRDGAFADTVALSASGDRPGATVTIAPGDVTPPGTATLTVTHTGGAGGRGWHTVTVTATGGGLTRSATASVLVGGEQFFLPLTRR